MQELFLKPEIPFLLLYHYTSDEYERVDSWDWFGSEDEMNDFIAEEKKIRYEFGIDDMFEIGSLREIEKDVTMNSGEFIEKVVEEYNFAKQQGFDSIVIVIETSSGEHEIYECDGGFHNDNFDCVYSELSEIAEQLYSEIAEERIMGFRIE